MIKANELRIGNLTKQGEVKSFFENGIHVGFGKCYNFNELEPIPLTEEWLLKLGFRTEESNCFELDNIHINTRRELMWVFTKCKNNIEIEIPEYVHQLQNLYFALTNEELTLDR